jgi:hypothetical protein
MRTSTRSEQFGLGAAPANSESQVEGELLFEAPTVEEALEEVAAELGSDARILGAEKVRRGGIFGFFARELIQVRALPSASPEADEATAAPGGVEGVLAQLSQRHNAQERIFADALRRQLRPPTSAPAVEAREKRLRGEGPQPAQGEASQPSAAGASQPAPAGTHVADRSLQSRRQPAPEPSSEPSSESAGTAAAAIWSLGNLRRLELPALVLDAVSALSPDDEPAWVYAVARAVEPLCRALPEGPAVLGGTRAHRLAAALGLEVVRCGGRPPAKESVAVQLTDAPEARSWLAGVRDGRWLHLVVGGDGWQGLLFDDPAAVSWVGAEAVCRGVRLAAELDLPLGFGLVDSGGPIRLVRASPFEVAAAIRAQLLRQVSAGATSSLGEERP